MALLTLTNRLAATARLPIMSTADLAGRLEQSFRILSGSAKTALPRQRTLHATID
jgi:predicted ATPase